jgi:hypothetical protein
VEAAATRLGMPPAYLRTQQITWVEISGGQVGLMAARIQLGGATRLERYAAHRHNQYAAIPAKVASWPENAVRAGTRHPADSERP